MNEHDYTEEDVAHARKQAWLKDFKALVRKHMPEYPTTDEDAYVLALMQESASCYQPWIWSDKE